VQQRTVKLGQMLTSLIERRGYSRNRQEILAAVGVSAAALSQYARDETRPSFLRLVALADFFGVSLDYLVFGEAARRTVDHGPLARHVDRALAEVQTRANRHSALVTRIGRVLADRINDVAREVTDSTVGGREGLLQADEMSRLERYSQRVHLLTTDLTADLATEPAGSRAEPVGVPVCDVVVTGLLRGCEYRFLVAGAEGHAAAVAAFRSRLVAQAGSERARQCCAFREVRTPVMFGVAFRQLDIAALARHEPALHAQVLDYVDQGQWLGCLMRTSLDFPGDLVLGRRRAAAARETFEVLWQAGEPL
jgi:transcriptional regulator with XRE-family HTH domain